MIDLATNTMYLDSFTDDGAGNYSHHIWALDITTGARKTAPWLVAASIQGTSVDAIAAAERLRSMPSSKFSGRR